MMSAAMIDVSTHSDSASRRISAKTIGMKAELLRDRAEGTCSVVVRHTAYDSDWEDDVDERMTKKRIPEDCQFDDGARTVDRKRFKSDAAGSSSNDQSVRVHEAALITRQPAHAYHGVYSWQNREASAVHACEPGETSTLCAGESSTINKLEKRMEGIGDAGFSGVQQNVDLHEPIEHTDDPDRSLMVDKRDGYPEVLRLIEIGTSSDGTADGANPSAALVTVDLEERDPEVSVRSEIKASSTAVAFESEDEADRSELSPFRRPTRLWKKVCESRVEMIINLYGIHAVRSAVEKEAVDYWSAQDARAESSSPSDSEASSASPHPTSAYRYRDTADSFEEPDSEPALTHSPSASIHDDDSSFMEWEPSEHSDDEDAGLIPDVDADPDSDDLDNRPVLRRSRAPSPEFAPFPTEAPSVVVVEENLPRLSSIPVRLTKEKVLVLRGTPACVAPWARGSLTPARVSS